MMYIIATFVGLLSLPPWFVKLVLTVIPVVTVVIASVCNVLTLPLSDVLKEL